MKHKQYILQPFPLQEYGLSDREFPFLSNQTVWELWDPGTGNLILIFVDFYQKADIIHTWHRSQYSHLQPHTKQQQLVMVLFPTRPRIHPQCQFQQSIPHSPVNCCVYSFDKYYWALATSQALYLGGSLQIKILKADMDFALTGPRLTTNLTLRVMVICQICSVVQWKWR